MSDTKTLETRPANATIAISTPSEINYHDTVKRNARRKADNGAQFSSTKGKTSLLLCVCDDTRSQLGIAKFDEHNKRTSLPQDIFDKCKAAIESFWQSEAQDIVQVAMANDAKITTRRGVLMSRIGKNDAIVRSKTDRITAVYVPKENEFKLSDTFGLTAAKQHLDTMLDNVGKYSREQLDGQRKAIALLENSIAGLK